MRGKVRSSNKLLRLIGILANGAALNLSWMTYGLVNVLCTEKRSDGFASFYCVSVPTVGFVSFRFFSENMT